MKEDLDHNWEAIRIHLLEMLLVARFIAIDLLDETNFFLTFSKQERQEAFELSTDFTCNFLNYLRDITTLQKKPKLSQQQFQSINLLLSAVNDNGMHLNKKIGRMRGKFAVPHLVQTYAVHSDTRMRIASRWDIQRQVPHLFSIYLTDELSFLNFDFLFFEKEIASSQEVISALRISEDQKIRVFVFTKSGGIEISQELGNDIHVSNYYLVGQMPNFSLQKNCWVYLSSERKNSKPESEHISAGNLTLNKAMG